VGRGGGTSPTSGLARDPGNNWQPHGVRVHRRAGEIERVLLCPNCETLRTQVLSLDGYLLPTWHLCPEQQLDSEAEPTSSKVSAGSTWMRTQIRVM